MIVTPFGILTPVNLKQFLNTPSPIDLILSGIVMFVKLVQYEKINPFNTSIPLGILILVNLEQYENAPSPIEVTLFGILIFVKPAQYSNA